MASALETAQGEAKKYRRLFYIAAAIVAVGVLAGVAWILGVRVTTKGAEAAAAEPNFPKGGPAEFLYLDNRRVAAYLAQIDGGSYSNIKESHKLAETLNGKVNLQGVAELGGSKGQEDFLERQVTATAASSFFALYSGLKKQHEVRRIRLGYFKNDVKPLREGQFVSFHTRALQPPVYLNAYLASRRPHMLTAIFPGGGKRTVTRYASSERRASRRFRSDLGKNPRAVFSLHAKKEGQEAPFDYLLPMNARRLTEEASLLKYGGGKFTVVGKIVRIFPEEGDSHEPPYVDSATLRTWEGPLRRAPGELLCRTDTACAQTVRAGGLGGVARRKVIGHWRRQIIGMLEDQTQIPKQGAVILPVAIYK